MGILDPPSYTRAQVDALLSGVGSGAGLPAPLAAVTAAGALPVGKQTPVNATAGPLTMTLPTGQAAGTAITVEKRDASANAVTVSGSIRGGASTLTLSGQFESVTLVADSAGSWVPQNDHKTQTYLTSLFAAASIPVTTQAASYTPVIADANSVIRMNAASAMVFTVPPAASVAYPIGTVLEVHRAGAGSLTFAPGAAVTINSPSGLLSVAAQFGVGSLLMVAADTWNLAGAFV